MSRTSPSNHHTISNHQKHSDMNSLCTAAASGDIEVGRSIELYNKFDVYNYI